MRPAPRVMVLASALDPEPRLIALCRPMSMAEIVATHRVPLSMPTIAVVSGVSEPAPIMRGEWNTRLVAPGETLAFVPVPGRGAASSIIAAVAGIALAVFAPFAAGWAVGALGLTGTAAKIGGALIGAGILIAGQFAINRLLPAPSQPSMEGGQVYTARASSNRAMPGEPVPVLYGEMRYPPPYAARPYAEFIDNDQYLYQLHCATCGAADVTRWEIGDTLVWTSQSGFVAGFAGDTEIEIVQPGGQVTLFPANVLTSGEVDGQTLPDAPAMLGPFAVSAPGTTVDRIMVDYVFPLGLVHVNSEGKANNQSRTVTAQYRAIDNAGQPVAPGTWSTLFSVTETAKSRTPIRRSRGGDVAPARYEVRLLASGSDLSDQTGSSTRLNRVAWAGLRGYVEDFDTPEGVTLIATKIRATEHLSREASGRYLFTCRRLLPGHDGETWAAPSATSSIAWAAADLLRNPDYGLGLADSDYDLAWLAAYHAIWASRGDRFDAIFDRRWQAGAALDAILRAGRAYHVRLGSRIGFVRDEPRQLRRMAFTPDTIVRGSLSRQDIWMSLDAPDHLEIAYLDRAAWAERTLIAAIGAIGQDRPQAMGLFGITGHDQAWREGIFQAAENAYRRSFRTFQVEREGRMIRRGDAVVLHDPLSEAIGFARLAGRDGDTLTLDRPLAEVEGETHSIVIRDRTGREWGPCEVASIDGATLTLDALDRATTEVVQGSLTDVLPDPAGGEAAHVALLAGDTRLFDGLVVEARPVGQQYWEVTLVNDDPRVHLADETEAMPSPWATPPQPPPVPESPVIRDITAHVISSWPLELEVAWRPASGAERYVAEISYGDDAVSDPGEAAWTPVHDGRQTRFRTTISPQGEDGLTIRVAGIGIMQGEWAYHTITVVPEPVLPDKVAAIQAQRADVRNLLGRLRLNQERLAEIIEQIAADTGAGQAAQVEQMSAVVRNGNALAASFIRLEAEVFDGENGLGALSELVAGATAAVGNVSAGGFFRVNSVAALDGAESTIALSTAVTAEGETVEAAVFLSALTAGGSGISFVADKFTFTDGSNTYLPVVIEDGEMVLQTMRAETIIGARIESPDGKKVMDFITGVIDWGF